MITAGDLADWYTDNVTKWGDDKLTEFVQEYPNLWILGAIGGITNDLADGFIDILRLGEGVAEGGFSGFLTDSFRLLTITPIVSGGIGKFYKAIRIIKATTSEIRFFNKIATKASLIEQQIEIDIKKGVIKNVKSAINERRKLLEEFFEESINSIGICNPISGAKALRLTGKKLYASIDDILTKTHGYSLVEIYKELEEKGGSNIKTLLGAFDKIGIKYQKINSSLETFMKGKNGVATIGLKLKDGNHRINAFIDIDGKLKYLESNNGKIYNTIKDLCEASNWKFVNTYEMYYLENGGVAKYIDYLSSKTAVLIGILAVELNVYSTVKRTELDQIFEKFIASKAQEQSVMFFFRSFIPKDVDGVTQVHPSDATKSGVIVKNPFTLNFFDADSRLMTDNRSFSSKIKNDDGKRVTARINHVIKYNFIKNKIAVTYWCDESIRYDQTDGKELGKDYGDPIVEHKLEDKEGKLFISFSGAARLPLPILSTNFISNYDLSTNEKRNPAIDYKVDMTLEQIDNRLILNIDAQLDSFPAFEFYWKIEGGEFQTIFQSMPPRGESPMDLFGYFDTSRRIKKAVWINF